MIFDATRDRAVIDRLIEALGVHLPDVEVEPARRERLAAFAALTAKWNETTNLIGAKTPEAVAEVLFADALLLMDERVLPSGARFVDVGAGAGAPALPLLLLRDDLHATLVEPRRLRVAFLRTAAATLTAAGTTVEARARGCGGRGRRSSGARATAACASGCRRGRRSGRCARGAARGAPCTKASHKRGVPDRAVSLQSGSARLALLPI